MSEHLLHYLILILLLFFTCITKYRQVIKIPFLIIVVMISLAFHSSLIHYDHHFIESLSSEMHQCCILPLSVSTESIEITTQTFAKINSLQLNEEKETRKTYASYYSRPPPLS